MSSQQYTQFSDDKKHLSATRISDSTFAPTEDAEAACTVCGARVTVGPDGSEYGHFGNCPERQLETHQTSKAPFLRIQCEECGRGFEHQVALANHERMKHEDLDGEYDCPKCGKEFPTRGQMRLHHYKKHDERLRETKTCEVCDEEFAARNNRTEKYCSLQCAGVAKRNQVELTCQQCGEEYTKMASQKDRSKYCSIDCFHDAQRKRETRECTRCGDTFEATPNDPKEYCSQSCFNKTKRKRETRTCPCGETFEVRPCETQQYCSRSCGATDWSQRETAD